MKEDNIEVVFNREKKRLNIFKYGKPVGGFVGNIAIETYEKIAFRNAKIEVKDDVVQNIVQ